MKTLFREAMEFFGFVMFGALCFAPLFIWHLL